MNMIRELCPNIPEGNTTSSIYALGIEGSANKVAVGIIFFNHITGEYETVANIRKTYITPAGQGFLPRYVTLSLIFECCIVNLFLFVILLLFTNYP